MSDALRERLAEVFGTSAAEILPARGFWHGAELVFRLFAAKGGAQIACRPAPEFRRLAAIYGASLIETPGAGTAAAFRRFDEAAAPLPADAIEIVDETDIEFSTIRSVVGSGSNALVLRGLGLAFSTAELPCALIGEAPLIARLEELQEPCAIPDLVQNAALRTLEPPALAIAAARRRQILRSRSEIAARLAASDRFLGADELSCAAVRVAPRDGTDFQSAARRWKIRFQPVDGKYFDLPLGSADDVSRICSAFDVERTGAARRGEVLRDTLETQISVLVDLDRDDEIDINTGVGFLDHMLTQIAHHGAISVMLSCRGDLDVDAHHTIEDCAIAFGQALAKALGDRRGIARFGYLLPMDEAEARVSVDLGGRPYLVFKGAFKAPLIGEYPTEMTEHIFRSLAQALGASIHVAVTGENDHHKTEACFKAFGRALRQAIRIEGDRTPSTKGAL